MFNIMWFRSDLRVFDNPALVAAMQSGPVIGVYCLAPGQWDKHDVAPRKRALIRDQLYALEQQLAELNVPLVILPCQDFSDLPEKLIGFAEQLKANQIFCNLEYELNEQNCLKAVAVCGGKSSIDVFAYHDQCMIAPGEVLTQAGQPFKVFSAFKRSYCAYFPRLVRPLHNRPPAQQLLAISSDMQALSILKALPDNSQGWPAGEDEAHHRLNSFLELQVRQYHERRDFPALDATSGLSAYMAIGAITTRQCVQAALSLNDGLLAEGHPGLVSWINELIWRDFYRHLLALTPRLCKYQPFLKETDALPWRGDGSLFKTWCDGKTGFPLVDAAMRQMNETGWMHNRLRMVCAMFLTKDLFVDWRLGERYFMQQLIDGDFASNNGGWQWSASTGVDAAPYFRIFNPSLQSKRFDPNGDFIRTYVKEFQGIPDKLIHSPDAKLAQELGYIQPIVNHSAAVADVKRWFQELKAEKV